MSPAPPAVLPWVRTAGSAATRVSFAAYLALGTLLAVLAVGFPAWVLGTVLLAFR